MGNIGVALANSADLSTSFSSALGTVKTDAMGYLNTALPIALSIVGAFIAVKLGIKFFKSITGK